MAEMGWRSKFKVDLRRARAKMRELLGAEIAISSEGKWFAALAIFCASFLIKSLHMVDLGPTIYTRAQTFIGITLDFDRRAISIAEGGGILFPKDQDPSDTGLLAHAPGYSIYLGAIYALLGRSYFIVQFIQNAINSLSPVLIFLAIGRLIGWRAGILSGLLSAISHHLSYYSNLILPDSLAALPLLASIYLLVVAITGNRWLHLLAGAMIGLSCWLRPNAMLMGPFLAIIFIIIGREAVIGRAAAMALASFLVIAPITIRNYLIYGEFVPIQIGLGLNLWEGIGESDPDGRFGAVAKDEEVALKEAELYNEPRYAGWWASPDGIKRDRDRIKKSLRLIANHPFWYAGVMLSRMREMTKYSAHAPLIAGGIKRMEADRIVEDEPGLKPKVSDEAALSLGRKASWLRPAARALQRIAKETAPLFVLVGAALVFFISWRRALLISAVPIYYLLFQSAMHAEFRYALPMHYFLFAFAAAVWVLIGAGVWAATRRLLGLRRRDLERS